MPPFREHQNSGRTDDNLLYVVGSLVFTMIEAGTETSSSPPAAISGTPTVTFAICPDDLETDEDYDGSDVGSPREGRF